MDEILGGYYKIILQHFSKIFKNHAPVGINYSNYWDRIEEILSFKEEIINSKEIIYQHSDIKDSGDKLDFSQKVVCLIFELFLFYTEELLYTIEKLLNDTQIDGKSVMYLNFLKNLLELRYVKDDEVIDKFNILLLSLPEDFEIIRILWDHYAIERDYETLKHMVSIAHDYQPKDKNSIMHFKGFLLKQMGNFIDALDVYKKILEFDVKKNKPSEKIAWDWMFIGDCHFILGNMSKTIECCNYSFRFLNEREENDLRVLLLTLRGKAYINQKNISLALKDFEDTLLIDKYNATAMAYINVYK